jgi:hypothetical protein
MQREDNPGLAQAGNYPGKKQVIITDGVDVENIQMVLFCSPVQVPEKN